MDRKTFKSLVDLLWAMASQTITGTAGIPPVLMVCPSVDPAQMESFKQQAGTQNAVPLAQMAIPVPFTPKWFYDVGYGVPFDIDAACVVMESTVAITPTNTDLYPSQKDGEQQILLLSASNGQETITRTIAIARDEQANIQLVGTPTDTDTPDAMLTEYWKGYKAGQNKPPTPGCECSTCQRKRAEQAKANAPKPIGFGFGQPQASKTYAN